MFPAGEACLRVAASAKAGVRGEVITCQPNANRTFKTMITAEIKTIFLTLFEKSKLLSINCWQCIVT
jgi:Leu/Phe-tRNA-protein transferase